MKYLARCTVLALLGVSTLATVQPRMIYCRIHQTDAFYEKRVNPNTSRCTDYYSHGYGEKKHTIVTACS